MTAVAKYWLFISANIYATLFCILNGLDLMKTSINNYTSNYTDIKILRENKIEIIENITILLIGLTIMHLKDQPPRLKLIQLRPNGVSFSST